MDSHPGLADGRAKRQVPVAADSRVIGVAIGRTDSDRSPWRRYRGSMLVAFSVTPLGVGEDVGEIVAEAVRVVRASGPLSSRKAVQRGGLPARLMMASWICPAVAPC